MPEFESNLGERAEPRQFGEIRSLPKKLAYALLSICLGILVTLLALEITLRFLPVSEGLRAEPVNARTPVFHFTPNRVSTFSEHWNFDIVNTVRVNNYGFVNDRDYDPLARTPLLAVIGDSYLEAAMVPFTQTAQARLAEAVAGRGRVYSFAASGAGLSQYLAWAEFVRDEFKPGGLMVTIISNDFSESLHDRDKGPGFHQFQRTADGGAVLRRTDYEPSFIRRVLRRSALAMYVIMNLKAHAHLNIPLILGKDDKRYVANVEADTPESFLRDSQWAADAFLDQLPARSGLAPSRILLVLDGFRPHMYDPAMLTAVQGSFWDRMREYLLTNARARGYEVIDLHPVFMQRYARDRRRFEFSTDTHWNGAGHAAVADAVRASAVFRTVFGDAR